MSGFWDGLFDFLHTWRGKRTENGRGLELVAEAVGGKESSDMERAR
jgi:hypothetical protein